MRAEQTTWILMTTAAAVLLAEPGADLFEEWR